MSATGRGVVCASATDAEPQPRIPEILSALIQSPVHASQRSTSPSTISLCLIPSSTPPPPNTPPPRPTPQTRSLGSLLPPGHHPQEHMASELTQDLVFSSDWGQETPTGHLVTPISNESSRKSPACGRLGVQRQGTWDPPPSYRTRGTTLGSKPQVPVFPPLQGQALRSGWGWFIGISAP